jgi:hypothetical protein
VLYASDEAAEEGLVERDPDPESVKFCVVG